MSDEPKLNYTEEKRLGPDHIADAGKMVDAHTLRPSPQHRYGTRGKCQCGYCLERRIATLEAESATLRSRLANRTMPLPNAQDLIDAQAENARLAALVERLAKWLPDPERMSGWGDPDATEEANMAITEVMALLAALSPTPTPAEQRPGEAKV